MQDEKEKEHEDEALDEALEETFPASDPIAVHGDRRPGKPAPGGPADRPDTKAGDKAQKPR